MEKPLEPAPTAAPPDLVMIPELAAELRVSRRTIINMTRDGRLPAAMKLPGQTGAWLYNRAEVDARLESLRTRKNARKVA